MKAKNMFVAISLAAMLLSGMAGMAGTFEASHYSAVLQGSCIYAKSWDSDEGYTPMGIYQMSESDTFAVVPFLITKKVMYSNGGGAFVGDDFYCVWKQEDPSSGYTVTQVIKWNLKTGERENLGVCDNNLAATTAGTAIDPQSGKVYGIFWNSSQKSARELGIVDYSNKKRTTIATIGKALYALCIDKTGQMYAIDGDGNLVKIDKSNGEIAVVGPTGIKPKYMQAAVVDTYTNKMYWNAITSKDAWICAVDLSTGAATKLAHLSDQNEFSAMRVLPPAAADKAPAPVTSLKANFVEANTTGTVSFTMPTEAFDGTPLAGTLAYQISNADEKLLEGTASPGQQVSDQVTTAQGMQTITVVAVNNQGISPKQSVEKYVGYDTPTAPTGVALTIDETGQASLSWQAPAQGVHGGYIDGQHLTYNVARQPDGETMATGLTATQWTTTLGQGYANAYKYSVTASNHGLESEAAVSNLAVYGSGLEIPWSCTFDDASSLDLFTIIDANGDDHTWRWTKYHEGAAYYIYSKTNAADDWLISPPLALKANKDYIVKFDNEVLKSIYPEKMELRYGQGLDTADYKVVMPVTTFTNAEYNTNAFTIVPEQDGDYRLAFHIVSDANQGSMSIDNLQVDYAPVSGVKTVTACDSENDNLTFDLCGRQVDGNNLQSGIYIRNGKKVIIVK